MHSREELTLRAQKALKFDVIQLIDKTSSVTAAENLVKAAEYPSSVCTAARSFALLREHHPNHYHKLAQSVEFSPDEDNPDVRSFNCGWAHRNNEEADYTEGVVHVTPKTGLPPLFWDYTVTHIPTSIGVAPYTIASTNPNEKVQQPSAIRGIFAEGSQSIPLGLQFRMWPRVQGVTVEFSWITQSKKIVWSRSIEQSKDDIFTRQASEIENSTPLSHDKITFTCKEEEPPCIEKSELVFSRSVNTSRWRGGHSFSCEIRMMYRLYIPDHPGETADRDQGCIFEDTSATASGEILIAAKSILDGPAQQQGHMFPLALSIGEMLSAPCRITTRKTLENCFSFKFQEANMLKCLAAV